MNNRTGIPNGGSPGRRDYGPYRADNSSNTSLSNSGYVSARERRAGGYGGFYETGTAAASSGSLQSGGDQYLRPGSSSSRSRTRERDAADAGGFGLGPAPLRVGGYGDMGMSRSRERETDVDRFDGAGGGGGGTRGAGSQQVDETLRSIQREWDFMAVDDCTPVQVGLQLMDNSTLGKADREPDFLRTHKQIQKSLRSIVNEHHQGFNSSIGTYHKIQSNIQSSQSRIRQMKAALIEAKSGLITTKPELKGLATASQSYDDILQLFGQIENIQSLPEKLEARISEKRFISAVEILQEALRLVRRSELENIGGLADVRTYFSNQETSLTDILIEELHDHLYLKSPYCQDRWKSPTGDDGKGGPNPMAANGIASWEKPLYRYLSNLDITTPLTEDASRNPEADTFHYIHVVIEALNKMGNLDVAVDRIEQRLPVELFAVVDKTSAEIAARYPIHTQPTSKSGATADITAHLNSDRGHVLSEFMWNLYAKFEAIAEGHRVVHDVVSGIVEREGIRKPGSLTSGFKELWKLYQSEIRSLLHDYLASDGEFSYRSTANGPEDGYPHSIQRDRTKKMFKLSEVDQKSSDIKKEQDDLDQILRSSVPGLVSKSQRRPAIQDPTRTRQENSGTGHKLLIEPSVFNMSLLLPPSLSFIQRLKDIVPLNSDIVMSTLTSFLDDFMINVFQPQLDEAVTELCTMSFIAMDAFTEDPQWNIYSQRPIFKGTISFMNLVKTFSKMLDNIPHDQMFTQLVISQIVTYFEKCSGWYKALVTRMSPQSVGGVRLKAAAAYVDSGEIRDVSKELWECSDNSTRVELIKNEIDLIMKATTESPLEPYDIVSDPKTVVSLSLLYNSLQWLASSLSRLRYITPHQADSSRPQGHRVSSAKRWTLITTPKPKRDSFTQPIYLPMTPDSVTRFDDTLKSIHTLSLTCLLTLHVDIRCGAIHMVTRSLTGNNSVTNTSNGNSQPQGSAPTSPAPVPPQNWNHLLSNPPTSASPIILDLNNDLISFDANISTYLGRNERRFITSGLAQLIDRAFVSGTRFIGAMNSNGAQRLQLDVLVLQQNLKNIITNPPSSSSTDTPTTNHDTHELIALPRSAKFLDWFLEGSEKALQYAQEEKERFKTMGREAALREGNGEPFTYDEMKVLVELCFSAALKDPKGAERREDFMAAKRGSEDALLRLSELMWDS